MSYQACDATLDLLAEEPEIMSIMLRFPWIFVVRTCSGNKVKMSTWDRVKRHTSICSRSLAEA